MSVQLIIALLLTTLAAAMLGAYIIASEAGQRHQMLRDTGVISESRYLAVRQAIERWASRTAGGRRLRRSLAHASLSTPLVDVVLRVVAGTALLLFLGNTIGGPILVVILTISEIFGLRAYLRYRRRRRLDQFVDQLPELARLLANATQAGLSLNTALSVAAAETQDPMRAEVRMVVDEVAFGQRLEDALTRMGERLPSRELALLVNVLVIQIRAGGHVVTALRGVTTSLESRRTLSREVKTLMAASKATMVAVVGLGLLIVWIGQSQVPHGMRGLLNRPIGLALCLVTGVLFILGIVLVGRISRVEV